MKTKTSKIILGSLIAFSLVAGSILFVNAVVACITASIELFTTLALNERLKEFKPTMGTVFLSEIKKDKKDRYYPDILYDYTAMEERHSNRIDIDPIDGGKDDEKSSAEWVGRFPEGAKITVYFDPAEPSFSVISLNRRDIFFPALISCVCLFYVIGAIVAIVILSIRQKTKTRTPL